MKAVKLDENTDFNSMKSIYNGDFCISLRSFQGGFEYSEYNGVVSPAYQVFYKTADISNDYYRYMFKERGFIDKMSSLTKTFRDGKSISFSDFADSLIPLPPLPEQQKIASYLDTQCAHIDSVIEKTKQSIEEYKKLKQAVITQAVTKGVRGEREMKDSGVEWIGEIPSNYSRKKLKYFSVMISKGTTPKEMQTEFDETYSVRYLKSENIINNYLSPLPLFTITEETHTTELSRSMLNEYDIVFVIAGASIGKCAIMDSKLLPANTNQATSFIRIKEKYTDYMKYIWYVLQSDIMKTYISLFAVQSAQPNMSMDDLGNFFVPIPNDNKEIPEITAYLDRKCAEIDTLITKKEQFLTELESYKKSMIYEYVTGKKEVPQ
ncbi:type I restriction enzyme, S subunit [Ruminococcaceae bacterium FB2012]|nr:type I restriction enzyme, S subunit [Ruminococcaceae bacterium FB2012]